MSSFPEFKWRPDLGAYPTRSPIVQKVSFGDGYELRVSESLNRVKSNWEVTFTRDAAECLEIDKFLTERAGLEAFRWNTPLNEERIFVCRQWRGPSQQELGLYVISAEFEEVFES